ncbi:MAG: hypothetical protein R2779_07325 [Crocinitomicaceae bacterium]
MRTSTNFVSDLKSTFYSGGMTVKLIFINVLVFIVIGVLKFLLALLVETLAMA